MSTTEDEVGTADATAVASIMADALGTETFAVDEDFFSAGGHSVAATRVVVALRKSFRRKVPINAVHEARTAEAVASALEGMPLLDPPRQEQRPAEWPLTDEQHDILTAMRVADDPGVYHICSAAELDGAVDTDRLGRAVTDAVAGTAAATWRLTTLDGQPRVTRGGTASAELHVLDAEEYATRAPALVSDAVDVELGPVVRAAVVRDAPDRHRLLVVVPHLFFDGTAVRDLFGAIAAAYRGERPASPAGDAGVPAGDGATVPSEPRPATRLWCQRERGTAADVRGGQRRARWTGRRRAALAAAAAACGTTTFGVVVAAVAALAWRTGAARPTVTYPVAGDGATGNRVVLDDLTLDLRAADTLRTVTAAVNDGVGRGMTQPRRRQWSSAPTLVVAPQVDVLADFALPGVAARRFPVHNGTAKFELTFLLYDEDDGLSLEMEYARASVTDEDAEQVLDLLTDLVDALCAQPDRALAAFAVHGARSPGSVLDGPRPDYDAAEGVHHRFARIARQDPDRVALDTAGAEITYGQLTRAGAAVAARIRERNLRAGAAIAVQLPRSPLLVAAMLGVLAAGHHYVLLDAAHPRRRRELIADVVDAGLLIAGPELVDDWDTSPVLPLDGFPDGPDTNDGWARTEPDFPACVYFTSGSTGVPKAVLSSHRATLRSLREQTFGAFSPNTRMLSAAALPWDAFTMEIWGPLLNGGTAVLHAGDGLDLASLAATCRSGAVNTAFLTTAVFNAMVEHHPRVLGGITELMFGGERTSAAHVRRWQEVVPKGQVLTHAYGPVEATVYASTRPVTTTEDVPDAVPIGAPVANTEIWVLDRFGHPVPRTVPGELHVGGDGLALGYTHDPAATADRFRPHPSRPGARLYRTGDVATVDRTGELHFLGRDDAQVKVSGQRVDLIEVENLVSEVAGTRCVVVAPAGPAGVRQLVAFVVRGCDEVDPRAVRAELARRVPAALIPSAFPVVDALPLTDNGKTDRRALLSRAEHLVLSGESDMDVRLPEDVRDGGHDPDHAARTVLLAVLGEEIRPGLDLEESFVANGGSSMAAARTSAELRRLTGTTVSPRELLQSSSLREVAALLRSRADASADERLVAAAHLMSIPRAVRAEVAKLAATGEGEKR